MTKILNFFVVIGKIILCLLILCFAKIISKLVDISMMQFYQQGKIDRVFYAVLVGLIVAMIYAGPSFFIFWLLRKQKKNDSSRSKTEIEDKKRILNFWFWLILVGIFFVTAIRLNFTLLEQNKRDSRVNSGQDDKTMTSADIDKMLKEICSFSQSEAAIFMLSEKVEAELKSLDIELTAEERKRLRLELTACLRSNQSAMERTFVDGKAVLFQKMGMSENDFLEKVNQSRSKKDIMDLNSKLRIAVAQMSEENIELKKSVNQTLERFGEWLALSRNKMDSDKMLEKKITK